MGLFDGAVGAVAGGVIGALGQADANRKNIALQREQMAQQYKMFQEANAFNHQERLETQEFNRNMWYEQQDFNSPINQAERLSLAGINPANALGGNSAQAIGSTPSSSPASSAGVPSLSPAHVDNAFGGDFTAGITAISNALLQQQQVQGLAIDNETRARENIARIDNLIAQKDKLLGSKELDKSQRQLIDEQRDNLLIERNLLQNQVDRISITNRQTDEMFEKSVQQMTDAHEQSILNREAQRMSNSIQAAFGIKMAEREYYRLGLACQHAIAEIGLIGSQQHLTDNQAATEVQRCTEQILKNVPLRHDAAHYPQIRKLINDELRAKIRQQNASAKLNEFGVSAGGVAVKLAPMLVGGAGALGFGSKALKSLRGWFGKGPLVPPNTTSTTFVY